MRKELYVGVSVWFAMTKLTLSGLTAFFFITVNATCFKSQVRLPFGSYLWLKNWTLCRFQAKECSQIGRWPAFVLYLSSQRTTKHFILTFTLHSIIPMLMVAIYLVASASLGNNGSRDVRKYGYWDICHSIVSILISNLSTLIFYNLNGTNNKDSIFCSKKKHDR